MTCCEWTSKDDVENYEEDIVVNIEELIMKKDMEYKETMRKTFKKAVHLMKYNYEKSIEVHNDLRLNVDKQQSDIDDADEVLEITAARTTKKKE